MPLEYSYVKNMFRLFMINFIFLNYYKQVNIFINTISSKFKGVVISYKLKRLRQSNLFYLYLMSDKDD